MAQSAPNIKVISTRPTSQDKLNYREYARNLAAVIESLDIGQTPFYAAIDGNYGIGKSSLLQMIEEELPADTNVMSCWFYLGRYAQYPNILGTFLSSLLLELSYNFGKDQGKELKAIYTKIVEMLKQLPMQQSAPKNDLLYDNAGQYGREALAYNKLIGLIRDFIRKVIGEYGKLVIFIDEVDYVEPQVSLNLILMLKRHFQIANCCIMLAANAEKLIEKWYRKLNMDVNEGMNLYQSIFQLRFKLPPLSNKSVGNFIRSHVENTPLEMYVQIIQEIIPGVTRDIVHFLNSLYLQQPVIQAHRLDQKTAILVEALKFFYPGFMDSLAQYDKKLLAAIGGVLKMSEAKGDSSQILSRLPAKLREEVENYCSDPNLAFFLRTHLPDLIKDLSSYINILDGETVEVKRTKVALESDDSLDDLVLPMEEPTESDDFPNQGSIQAVFDEDNDMDDGDESYEIETKPIPKPKIDKSPFDYEEKYEDLEDDDLPPKKPGFPDEDFNEEERHIPSTVIEEEDNEDEEDERFSEHSFGEPMELSTPSKKAKEPLASKRMKSVKVAKTSLDNSPLSVPKSERMPGKPPPNMTSKSPLNRDTVIKMFEEGKSLEGQNLAGADLRDLDLKGINLKGSNLSYANLERANLRKANLSGAFLNGTALIGANMMDAILTKVNCENTDFMGANLWGADLREAMLANTHFRGANLRATNLENADLSNANLMGAEMVDCNLTRVNLTGIIVDQHSSFHFACVNEATMDAKTRDLIGKKYTVNDKNILMPKLQGL